MQAANAFAQNNSIFHLPEIPSQKSPSKSLSKAVKNPSKFLITEKQVMQKASKSPTLLPLKGSLIAQESLLGANAPTDSSQTYRISQQLDLFSDHRPLLKNNSEYHTKYNNVLQTTGFGISHDSSSKAFDTPRIFRTESKKIETLKNKIQKAKKKQYQIVTESVERKKNRVKFIMDIEEKKLSEEKETPTEKLKKDIDEFEERLEKIKNSPKSTVSQKEIYSIDEIKAFRSMKFGRNFF